MTLKVKVLSESHADLMMRLAPKSHPDIFELLSLRKNPHGIWGKIATERPKIRLAYYFFKIQRQTEEQ